MSLPARPLLYLLLACLLTALHVSAAVRLNGMPDGHLLPSLDDAWIHARYAEAIWQGTPWVYTPGDGYSSGATSLLWPILLLPGLMAGLDAADLHRIALLWAPPLLAWSAISADRWISRFFSTGLPPAADATGYGAWAGYGVLLCGPYVWGAASGMEVALVGAALIATVERHGRGAPPDRGMALCLGLLSASRPEGALIALLTAAHLLWRHRDRPAAGLIAPLLPAAIGAVQPLLNLAMTGAMTGTSVLAKHNPRLTLPQDVSTLEWFVDSALIGAHTDHFFGGAGILLLPVAGVGLIALSRRQGWLPLAAFLIPLAALALLMPMLLNQARHLMPGLALYVPALIAGAVLLERRFLPAGATPWIRAAVLATLLAGTPRWAWYTSLNARDLRQQHVAAAAFLARHAAPGDTVAVNDAGFVPVLTGLTILDLEGVTSARVLPWALAGEGSMLVLIDRERPDWLAVFPTWFPGVSAALDPQWSARLARRTISGGDTLQISRLRPAVLDSARTPPALQPGEAVLDTLDLSDLDSEAAHAHTQDEDAAAAARANTAVLAAAPGDVPGSDVPGGDVQILDGARRYHGCTGFRLSSPREGPPITRLAARIGPSSGEALIDATLNGRPVRWRFPPVADGRWIGFSVDVPPTDELEVNLCVTEAAGGVQGGVQIARWWGIGAGG